MEIVNNAEHRRFEAGKARLNYRMTGPATVEMVHTEVPAEYQGHGLAGELAQTALDWARAQGFKVIPSCTYVKRYIEEHPEYADLVQS